MARIVGKASVSIVATFELSEEEMGALDALAGYGTDEFLRVFYEKMGRAHLEPHEKGLRTLFDSVRGQVPRILADAHKARSTLG